MLLYIYCVSQACLLLCGPAKMQSCHHIEFILNYLDFLQFHWSPRSTHCVFKHDTDPHMHAPIHTNTLQELRLH